jgi:hypothetical protein
MIEEPWDDWRPKPPKEEREKYHYVWVPKDAMHRPGLLEVYLSRGYEVVPGVPEYQGEVLLREPIEREIARRKRKEEESRAFLRGRIENLTTGEITPTEPIRVRPEEIMEPPPQRDADWEASVFPAHQVGGSGVRTPEDLLREAQEGASGDVFEDVFE